ncbi:hypothetical protein ACWF50_13250 [Brucella pseudogrignonensis]
MTKIHFDPARRIIQKVGVGVIADATGVHVSRVYRWMYGKDRGGTGGVIPIDHIRPIMTVASSNGVKLCADDFLPDAPTAPRKQARASA